MQNAPPKADLPKRKRRWLQFSLRTLLVGITLACLLTPLAIKTVEWATAAIRDGLHPELSYKLRPAIGIADPSALSRVIGLAREDRAKTSGRRPKKITIDS